MAGKTLPSSSGYFNKEMLSILKKGETKKTPAKKKTTSKQSSKKR